MFNKQLIAAIENSDPDAALLALNAGASYETQQSRIVHWAIDHWHNEIVDFLLADPKFINTIQSNPSYYLTYAIQLKDCRFFNRLLENQSIVEALANHKNAALHLAIEEGKLPIVKKLLEHPAVIKDLALKGNYALRAAAERGHRDILNLLLQYPNVVNDIDAEENDALCTAAKNGHFDIVERLLKYQKVKDGLRYEENYAVRMAMSANVPNKAIVVTLAKHMHNQGDTSYKDIEGVSEIVKKFGADMHGKGIFCSHAVNGDISGIALPKIFAKLILHHFDGEFANSKTLSKLAMHSTSIVAPYRDRKALENKHKT